MINKIGEEDREKSRAAKWFMLLSIVIAVAGAYLVYDTTKVKGRAFPQPTEGVIDLREWDVAKEGTVGLAGKWLMRRAGDPASMMKPVRVPGHLWRKELAAIGEAPWTGLGQVIYEVTLDLPSERPPLAIEVGRQVMSARVFINGRLAGLSGYRDVAGEGLNPRTDYTLADVPIHGNRVHIRLEITNDWHFDGGYTQPVLIGPRDAIYHDFAMRKNVNILTMALTAAIGLLCLFPAFSGQRGHAELFWFAAFCLVGSFRIGLYGSVNGELFPDVSLEHVTRMNYLSIFALPLTYLCYQRSLFRRHVNMPFLPAWCQPFTLLQIGFLVLLILAMILPVTQVTTFRDFFMMMGAFAFVAIFSTLFFAIKRGSPTGWAVLCMAMILLIGFLHDVMMTQTLVYGREWVTMTFPGFIVGQIFILTSRMTHAYKQNERLRDKLVVFNRDLEVTVHERTLDLEDARADAEAANAAKSQFLATMSHEIRTPMNGVMGMLDMLRLTRLSGEQQDLVNTVHDSSVSLLTIINDILDFSKIEAGKLDLEVIETRVLDILEAVAGLLGGNAFSKGLDFVIDVDPSLDLVVMSDPTRLRQILLNLTSNAVKFTEAGSITLRLSRVNDQQEEQLLFEVIDTGIGLSEEARGRLFSAFEQADDSTTRKFGGTGLGLSICKTLAELMGGSVGVDSAVGEGSAFWLRLPLNVVRAVDRGLPDLNGVRVGVQMASDRHHLLTWRIIQGLGAQIVKLEDGESEALTDVKVVECFRPGAEPVLPDDAILNDPKTVLLAGPADVEAGYFTKAKGLVIMVPLRVSDFWQALAQASGLIDRALPELEMPAMPAGLRIVPDLETARNNNQLILVAEDHPTNQRLIRMQINKLGYACDIVDDGMAALAYLGNPDTRRGVGLLISDYHMPIMNGMDLAMNWRRVEAENGLEPLYILGLTAAAMSEEVESLKAAGMDAILTKPVSMESLERALGTVDTLKSLVWALPEDPDDDPGNDDGQKRVEDVQAEAVGGAPGVAGDGVVSAATDPVYLDMDTLKSFFGDDHDGMRSMVNAFLDTNLSTIGEIETAIQQQDQSDMHKLTHSIKGSSLSIGMKAAGDKAALMEERALGNSADYDWGVAANDLEELRHLLDGTQVAVKALA